MVRIHSDSPKKKQITTSTPEILNKKHHSSTFCNLFPSMNPLIMHNYCTFQWVIFVWQVTIAAAHTTAAGHIVVPTSAVERASLAAWVGVNRLPLKRCQSATRLVVVLTNCGVGRLVSKLYKAVCSGSFWVRRWFSITGALVLQPKLQELHRVLFLAAKTHDVSGRHLPKKK